MNDVIKAIQMRRTIRKFKAEPVPSEKLEAVLEAGRWAQSFNNSQPWRFVIVREEKTKKRLSEEAGKSVYYRGIVEAPVTVVICADTRVDPNHWIQAGCIAHQNMALAAHSLDLGTSWIAVLNTESEKPIKRTLGIPKPVRVISLMPLGSPNEEPQRRRNPLTDMVYDERYGEGG
jgi:nitroreductase